MSGCTKVLIALITLATLFGNASLAQTNYLITNNDNPGWANSASVFSIGEGGALTLVQTIATGSSDVGAAYFGSTQVGILRSKTNHCAYIGDAYGKRYTDPADVAAIDLTTLTLVGTYPGFPLDSGALEGVGLSETPNGTFLFAAFSLSDTITTYQQEAGCKLKRLGQIITVGARNNGPYSGGVQGMKVTPNGNFLILTYGDGSIGSYKIDANTGALQLVGRSLVADGGIAAGIDISSDSKWAVFGAANASTAQIEVASIRADGSLGPTHGYAGIGSGLNSSNVWFSPDETILYIGNNSSGQITAVPFSRSEGAISAGQACTSPVLTKFSSGRAFLTGLIGSSETPTGSPLYATASSEPGAIVIVNFEKPCTLKEASFSPVIDSGNTLGGLAGAGMDPPRSF